MEERDAKALEVQEAIWRVVGVVVADDHAMVVLEV